MNIRTNRLAAAAATLSALLSGSVALAGGGGTGADIQVSGSASTGSPNAGASFTYTYQVKNSGPDLATGVGFTDTLPFGTGFSYAFVSFPGSASPCSVQNMVVSCNLGSMSKGSQAVVTIGLTAPVTAGSFTNTGTATATSADPQPSNNSTTVTVQVKTALAPCPVPAGEPTLTGMVMWESYISSPSGPLMQDFEFQANGVNYYVLTNFYDGTQPLTTVINLDCKQSPVQFVAVGNFVNVTGTIGTAVVGGTEMPVIYASFVQVFTHKDAI